MANSYVGLYDSAGSRNTFFVIAGRRKLGFKCFQNKDHADFAYRIQSGLAETDMAPKVYGDIGRIRYDKELTDWGYLTEVAKPMKDCCDEECDGECYDSGCYNACRIQEVTWTLENQYGLVYADAHRGNFGWIRRNRCNILVPIDFGIESFGYIEEEKWGEVDWDSLTEESCDCTACRYESI
jgi:hypothetical protein